MNSSLESNEFLEDKVIVPLGKLESVNPEVELIV